MELRKFLELKGYKLLEEEDFQGFFDSMGTDDVWGRGTDLKIFSETFLDCFDLNEVLSKMHTLNRHFGMLVNYACLKHLKLPTSIKELDGSTFANCSNLESIELSQDLKKFGSAVFIHCEALKSIELPESLEEIGWGAFYGCKNLELVV